MIPISCLLGSLPSPFLHYYLLSMSGAFKSYFLVSCNFPSLPNSTTRPSPPRKTSSFASFISSQSLLPIHRSSSFSVSHGAHWHELLYRRHRAADGSGSGGDPVVSEEDEEVEEKDEPESSAVRRVVADGGSAARVVSYWTTSVLLFGVYAAILYYVFRLAPNQTPSRDVYFIEKLLNLKGNDGFKMNEVLVALWYIMGLWPLLYSMLLLPTARSPKGSIPVWPFLSASFFGGAYALIPYFILWKPPPPPVKEEELKKWPLNFLESKITAWILFASGLGLIIYAALASAADWTEFYQYFRESKLVHATSLDFSLLSAFSAFWVYNDMTARRWYDKGSWLVTVSLIPFVGPALYLLLRPPISNLPSISSSKTKNN